MYVNHPVIPVIYILPKIYKQYTEIPPGRPIVSAIGSFTEKISAFVHNYLQPLVTLLPSYIRDSMDLLHTIEIPDECLLVTMDIESLYTNVPFEGGLRATEFFLDQHTNNTPSTTCIIELTDLVLTSFFFLFQSDFYLQVSGTSMGSKMAPGYASLFCGFFEHNIIFNENSNPHLKYIMNWRRYIDDIFFIWTGTAEQLEEFHDFINSKNYHLKFTMEYSANKMNFLDIFVYKDSNRLASNLYRKATDRNSILHGHSFHPVFSLPISQYQTQAKDVEKTFSTKTI